MAMATYSHEQTGAILFKAAEDAARAIDRTESAEIASNKTMVQATRTLIEALLEEFYPMVDAEDVLSVWVDGGCEGRLPDIALAIAERKFDI